MHPLAPLHFQKNPGIVQWCPLCAGQAPPPLLPIEYPCPACPADQVCGSCAPGPQANDPDTTMYLNVGSCPACPAHDTRADWRYKHGNTVKARGGSAAGMLFFFFGC